MRAAESVAGTAMESAKTLTASYHDVSVVKHTFYHGEKAVCILAVHTGETDQEVISYLQNYILNYIVGFISAFLVLTVCVNGILSCWISKSVLVPLQKLSRGTKEIKEGNLDTSIDYTKEDEFGEVCRDFDEMRAYLKESVEQRLKDEQRKKDLIIGISHDLRTPLTSISGYLDGLMDGIADTPEKRSRYLQAIKIRTGNLVSLVDSLSEYSRLDNGFRYRMEKADFKEFVEQYLEIYRSDAEQNHVEIEFLCGKETYPVQIDREDDARTQSEKGSGIGLAVVKEIILGHGGSVWAENRQGLAMIIHLPIAGEDIDGENTDRGR